MTEFNVLIILSILDLQLRAIAVGGKSLNRAEEVREGTCQGKELACTFFQFQLC